MEYKITYNQYQQELGEGKFIGVKCTSCDAILFPPGALCRECGHTDLEPVELKGEGTVRTFTVVRVAPEGRIPPYVVAMVELEEGPWAMGNLIGIDPEKADMNLIGKSVKFGSYEVKGDTYSPDARVLTFTLF